MELSWILNKLHIFGLILSISFRFTEGKVNCDCLLVKDVFRDMDTKIEPYQRR